MNLLFNGKHWQARQHDQQQISLLQAGDQDLPTLDTQEELRILLSIEQLIVRPIHFPLSKASLLDQEIVQQELEDQSHEKAQDWWLAWHVERVDDGLRGLLFAMPKSLQEQLKRQTPWQHAKHIGIDAWEQLEDLRQRHLHEAYHHEHTAQTIAVIAADRSGCFLGIWQTNGQRNGFWSAMRRLNCPHGWADAASLQFELAQTLKAMHWQKDSDAIIANIPESLYASIASEHFYGKRLQEHELTEREQASLALEQTYGLNFRHGVWSKQNQLTQLKPWYRSIALASCLLLLWMATTAWTNHRLQQAIEDNQQQLIAAFHQGLPHESVLIDAIAQLKQAAGQDDKQTHMLQQLNALHRVFAQHPWQTESLHFKQQKYRLSGSVASVQKLDQLQQALQKEMAKPIKITDTNLGKGNIQFSMEWS